MMTIEEAKYVNREIASICDSFECCSDECPFKSIRRLRDATNCLWAFESFEAKLEWHTRDLYKYDGGIKVIERLSEFLIGTKWDVPIKFDIGNQNDFIELF